MPEDEGPFPVPMPLPSLSYSSDDAANPVSTIFPMRPWQRRFQWVTQPWLNAEDPPIAVGPAVNGAAGTAAGTGLTTISVPLPPAWATGNALLVAATSRSTASGFGADPSGWTALVASFDSIAFPGTHMALYGKIAGASESDPTLTFGTGRVAAVSVAVKDHGLAAITDLVRAWDNTSGASTSIVAPSVTPPDAASLLLCFFGGGDGTTANLTITVAPPGSMTEVADVASTDAGASDTVVEAAYEVLTSAAATGTRTATATTGPTPGNVHPVSVTVAVRATAAAGAPSWAPPVISSCSGIF